MTADPRDNSGCQLCQHFDNFTKSHSLVPYKGSESVYASQDTKKYQSFLMYNSLLYALGVVTGFNYAEIGLFTDVSNPTVSSPTGGADVSGTTAFDLFVEYKKVIYGASAGTRIWSYDIVGATFNGTAASITYTNITQGIVHSKDDVLYFGVDNFIYYKNGAGAITKGLTLPSNLIVSSICEFGNYLAIACRPLYANSVESKLFLWDRQSSLNDLSESVSWGRGSLYAIETIDGYLIGVSVYSGASSSFPSKVVFSRYSGGGAVTFKQIFMTNVPTIVGKQKYNNRMYFGLSAATSIGGTTNDYVGIWSVGRNGETEPFSVSLDRVPNNGTSTSQIKGFILVQDFMYISYLDATNSDAFALSKTNDQSVYNTTATYRTSINQGMPEVDKPKLKKLVAVALTYPSFPSGGQAVLKVRKDGGSWQTVFTETTAGVPATEMAALADGTNFGDGRDWEFQIECGGTAITGETEVTGLVYRYEIVNTKI